MNDAGQSATIDWPQIQQVRLYCDQVKTQIPLFSLRDIPTLAYFCELTLNNKKRIVLVSGFLDERGEWLALDTAYRDFVESLHDRLHASRSRTRFRRGLTWPRLLNYALVTNLSGLALKRYLGHFALIFIPISLLLLIRHFPRRYRPDRLPQRVLPPD